MADAKKSSEKQSYSGKDMLLLPDGSTYHLGVKEGELANRIISCGSLERARIMSTYLDKDPPCLEKLSSRQFLTFTGKYKGVPVSIVGIGMGVPMVDFFFREASFVLHGPMAVMRFGSCGLIDKNLDPGSVVVADDSLYVYKNYAVADGFYEDDDKYKDSPLYVFTKALPADPEFTDLLFENLKRRVNENGSNVVFRGLNASSETFYACEGRKTAGFVDDCAIVLEKLEKYGVKSLEMETHNYFHLAKLRTEKTRVAGCAVGIVNRTNPDITAAIAIDDLKDRYHKMGQACLDTIIEVPLSG